MKGRSEFWGKFQLVSDKQIELALSLNGYRKKFNLSQKDMAKICSLYGASQKIAFSAEQISSYETMKTAPRIAKYQVLCNVLNI